MSRVRDDDLGWMRAAIVAARAGLERGDRPHGAVAVWNGEVVAAHDETASRGDPTAHAITLALRGAARLSGAWRLDQVTVVATHEPCVMCAGALLAARVARLVYGSETADGAAGTRYNVLSDPRLGVEVAISAGLMAAECRTLDPAAGSTR